MAFLTVFNDIKDPLLQHLSDADVINMLATCRLVRDAWKDFPIKGRCDMLEIFNVCMTTTTLDYQKVKQFAQRVRHLDINFCDFAFLFLSHCCLAMDYFVQLESIVIEYDHQSRRFFDRALSFSPSNEGHPQPYKAADKFLVTDVAHQRLVFMYLHNLEKEVDRHCLLVKSLTFKFLHSSYAIDHQLSLYADRLEKFSYITYSQWKVDDSVITMKKVQELNLVVDMVNADVITFNLPNLKILRCNSIANSNYLDILRLLETYQVKLCSDVCKTLASRLPTLTNLVALSLEYDDTTSEYIQLPPIQTLHLFVDTRMFWFPFRINLEHLNNLVLDEEVLEDFLPFVETAGLIFVHLQTFCIAALRYEYKLSISLSSHCFPEIKHFYIFASGKLNSLTMVDKTRSCFSLTGEEWKREVCRLDHSMKRSNSLKITLNALPTTLEYLYIGAGSIDIDRSINLIQLKGVRLLANAPVTIKCPINVSNDKKVEFDKDAYGRSTMVLYEMQQRGTKRKLQL